MEKIFISCGETSGDRYAAEIVKTLVKNKVQCFGNGGDHMIAAQAVVCANVVYKSSIGFIEPIIRIPYFLYILNRTKSKQMS